MKRLIIILMTLLLCLGFSMTALAAGNENTASMSHFTLSSAYTSGQYSDVNEAAWYGAQNQAVIKEAFELGIMNGMGNGLFNPDGNVKLCELIKMAALVHSIYSGDNASFDITKQPWYQDYVNYAIENGIIKTGDFHDYTAASTRAQMAYILDNALPETALQQINTVNSIPDVANTTPVIPADVGKPVFALYRAGVLVGDVGTHAFYPYANMTRAEAAAVITHIALQAERLHFEILPDTSDVQSHGPDFAMYNSRGSSLALGYQSAEALKTFFNTDPVTIDKYGFTDGANIYKPHYQGIGSVTYLLSDYSAGGIYVYGIDITSGEYKLANGLHVGSAVQELQAVYGNKLQFSPAQAGGDGAFQPNDIYIYPYYPQVGDNSPWRIIEFTIENGVVSEIGMNCSLY